MGWEDPDPADVVPLDSGSGWQNLRERYDPNHLGRPFQRCLEVVESNGAKTAVIETRYIDLDYRSEYSSFFSRTFIGIPDSTHRIHFFNTQVSPDSITDLNAKQRSGYLGYLIVRPSPLGRVGRTMLLPPPDMQGIIQSSVRDRVYFFGQELEVEGVPFAQQDTQFGRCAHVAAWICHYAAHLRGDVSRRRMADFSLFADASVALGRPVPSPGLTGLQLSNLMREFDLPPIVYQMGNLPSSGQEPTPHEHDEDDDPGTWDTRAVAVLCRFLNSTYPVLVCTQDHAFVVVGYQRAARGGEPWINFIRHDDQRGPYLWIDDILKDEDPVTGDVYTPWQLLVAPVPDKLWLLPEAAERAGRDLLLAYDDLEGTGTFEALLDSGRLTFRTFAVSANAFKENAARRQLGSDALKELRLARLSRQVWVVEAVDRDARINGSLSVLGEAIFDSTSSDLDPHVHAVRVPGALLIQQTDGTIRSPLPTAKGPTSSAAKSEP